MGDVECLADRHCEPKRWGWEEWIANGSYCGKRLHFTAFRGATSMHFHAVKHETMYVESGSFEVVVIDTSTGRFTTRELSVGDSTVIPPLTPHRIICTSVPAVMVEFSTHHCNDDSYRVEP